MPKIHVLDQNTINQIAAGEVIERPMAVVKELVENAIDAQANAITVEVKDGGKELIRITDNGTGIAKEDIVLAFTPHATSKIKGVEDLLGVSSLGFRGEALASVAAVSQLEMVTKTKEALMGNRYVIQGGEEKTLEAVGCPEGTTFLIRNLFYNTPARLKFLKSSPTETGYISTVLERLALSHPEVAFRFIAQNQTKLSTPGNGKLKDVIYHIYGRDIASNLLEVHREEVFCEVEGFLGKPVISRGNRNYMNYFINGRFIQSKVIHRAIEEAYAPYSMQHRYPFTALHFTIDPAYIDVNVHPQKMEIRFTREKEIFQSVFHAVSEGLKQREFIPEVSLVTEKNKVSNSERGAEFFEKKRRQEEKVQVGVIAADERGSKQKATGADLTEREKKEAEQLGIMHAQKIVSEPISQPNVGKAASGSVSQPDFDKAVSKPISQQPVEKSESVPNLQAVLREEAPVYSAEQRSKDDPQVSVTATESEKQTDEKPQAPAVEAAATLENVKQASMFEEQGALEDQALRELRIVGQVFQTYWILQYEDAMYLVDQHAAHEKVLYERFMKQLQEKQPMIQMVQPPMILSLSMQEEQALQEHQELFRKLGFEIDSFGGREYAISGIPAHLPSIEVQALFVEALALCARQRGVDTPEILLDKIASMSCKAAVKGNNKLDMRQAEELMRELMSLDNPYHCPHGRPTMIRMTKRELEKKFKRIV